MAKRDSPEADGCFLPGFPFLQLVLELSSWHSGIKNYVFLTSGHFFSCPKAWIDHWHWVKSWLVSRSLSFPSAGVGKHLHCSASAKIRSLEFQLLPIDIRSEGVGDEWKGGRTNVLNASLKSGNLPSYDGLRGFLIKMSGREAERCAFVTSLAASATLNPGKD